MACRECYKWKRCFERRGVCSEYRSKKEIRKIMEDLNNDWHRAFGNSGTAFMQSDGKYENPVDGGRAGDNPPVPEAGEVRDDSGRLGQDNEGD